MNICFVIPRMRVGGAERVIVELCRGLKARGHRVAVISEGGQFADQLVRHDQVPHHTIPDFLNREPAYVARSTIRLAGILRRLRPEVINVHGFTPVPMVAAAARLLRPRPAVGFTLHAPERPSVYRIMGRTLEFLVDDTSTVCVESRRKLYEHGYPRYRGEVTLNGIDPGWLRPVEEIDARPVPGETDPIVLGVLSRLIEAKGIQDLLEALAVLEANGDTRFRLEIAGDGPYRAELEQRVARHRLEGRVTLHGRRDDAHAFLDRIDVSVLPSWSEGLPMSILEAMARGTPVLSSAVGGVPEVVTERATGFLFPPKNVPALVRALERLAADPAMVREVRRRARDMVAARFLTGHMVAGYERWFERLIEEKGARTGSAPDAAASRS